MNRLAAQLVSIYRPKYIALNIALAAVYYFVYTTLLSIQQYGLPLISFPYYLIYILVATSSIVLTIAVYSISNSRNNYAKLSASTAGTATTLLGAVFGGCGCTAPLLFSFTVIGISSSQIIALDNFINANQVLLLAAMIAINLFVMIYYINRLSKPSCRLKRR